MKWNIKITAKMTKPPWIGKNRDKFFVLFINRVQIQLYSLKTKNQINAYIVLIDLLLNY